MTTSVANVESEDHQIVSQAEWLAARQELLRTEKEITRMRDEVARQRRALPWVRVEKEYVFDGPAGKETLADLFAGCSQLIVYHFMLGPGWKEGCVGCSFLCDHVDSARQHFEQHDLKFVAVSRAPFAELDAFRWRMGWQFKWLSSLESAFNYDYQVSFTAEELAKGPVFHNYAWTTEAMEELSGLSVFYKDASGAIYHTYSTYGRGGEEVINAYNYLDLTPKGRNETGPGFDLTDWVRHHDRYSAGGFVNAKGRYIAPEVAGAGCCSQQAEA